LVTRSELPKLPVKRTEQNDREVMCSWAVIRPECRILAQTPFADTYLAFAPESLVDA
jgi:hypothetical protein